MAGSINDVRLPPRPPIRRAALKDIVPPPSAFVIWRATTLGDGEEVAGYELPGRPGRQDEAAFRGWLNRKRLAGFGRLAVSVLVIREHLDDNGVVREAVLERRRGGVGGPFDRTLARVEFTGALNRLRRYRAERDGALEPMPDDDAAARATAPDPDPESYDGEDAAVLERLGPGTVILDRRPPDPREKALGLSGIIHALTPDGREAGCGVGWHGTEPFVLIADFVRHRHDPVPPAALDRLATAVVEAKDLIRHEARRDEKGFMIMARRRARLSLVAIRQSGGKARVETWFPGRTASANEDQRRWMVYAETYEGRRVIDSWRDGDSGGIAAVTLDQGREAWRHVIDTDGIEVRRHMDNDGAAAALHRALARPPEEDPDITEPPEPVLDIPADTLTARLGAFLILTEGLRAVMEESGPAKGDHRTRVAIIARMQALAAPARHLGVRSFAGTLWHLTRLSSGRRGTREAFHGALERLVVRIREELALLPIIPPPGLPRPSEITRPDAPFEFRFPAAALELEEAAHALAHGRAKDAVDRAGAAMRTGLTAAEHAFGLPPITTLPWSRMATIIRAAHPNDPSLPDSLTSVRRAWRRTGLSPAARYTEAETEAVLSAVAAFLGCLSLVLEVHEVVPLD
jgi:hypothetical protein